MIVLANRHKLTVSMASWRRKMEEDGKWRRRMENSRKARGNGGLG